MMKPCFLLYCLCAASSLRAEEPKTKCQSLPPYRLVVRDRTDSVNSEVIVKKGTVQLPCAYPVALADFEIKDVNTNGFVRLAEPYLFLGGGTGPDGGEFVVYDLNAKKKVWQHNYAIDDLRVSGGTVTFTDRIGNATPAQCKDYDKITKQGLSATAVAEAKFSLADLAQPQKLKTLSHSKQRCIATQ